MSTERNKSSNELVLSNGEYAYTQDTTSGVIKAHTGPLVINTTGQEIPVSYDAEAKRFERVSLERSVQHSPLTPQGCYCVLWNPSEDGDHPEEQSKDIAPALQMGQRVNIPGPCTSSLWPRQSAKVIAGHHLRSNQYLLVRVYDEHAAVAHWASAVIKPADPGTGDQPVEPAGEAPRDLSVGRLFVIRGTEVSFYMPPTGVEVVAGEDGAYVRDAITLERLEYCILIDEDGNKRYERGPAVVFPRPTEHVYEESSRGERVRVFRPIELSPVQGIHVKVIADYTDDAGRGHREGEELFITGQDTPIYFPRQEHSLISYDGRGKHFATAVPAGEARYVMARKSGEIRMVSGPTMLLPDPRQEVIVRRALSDGQCELWYPDNGDALVYNRRLRELAMRAPTTRTGAVSEGQLRQGKKHKGRRGAYVDRQTAMEASQSTSDSPAILADEFSRGSTFNEPRTLTLHTRFAGVPTIEVWNGYAVMVKSKTGARRVEVGPVSLRLAWDESLEVVQLSAGAPKRRECAVQTVYLRLRNNHVVDEITAETADNVQVVATVSMRVDFEGEPERWFAIENYVEYLCDHVRSALKVRIRELTVAAFTARSEDIIRDAIMGRPVDGDDSDDGGDSGGGAADAAGAAAGARPGLRFADNGMRVVDVEVREVAIADERIAQILAEAQHRAVQGNVELAAAQRELDVQTRMEEIARARATAAAETDRHAAALESERVTRELELTPPRSPTCSSGSSAGRSATAPTAPAPATPTAPAAPTSASRPPGTAARHLLARRGPGTLTGMIERPAFPANLAPSTDDEIAAILRAARVVAILGASTRSERAGFYVADYLHEQGYRVLPVNPTHAGETLWGERVRASLAELDDLDEPIDLVDVFRRPDALPAHATEILSMSPRPRVVWFQLGIRHDAAADALRRGGIITVQDRCTLADHDRLGLPRHA